MELIRRGKVKSVYDNADGSVIIQFRDDITAGNGAKHDIIEGKGILLNEINEIFFNLLNSHGVATHYVKKFSANAFKAKKVQIIPLEVVVRNYAAGSFCKRYGIEKGKKLEPIVEFFLKDDALEDPLICKNVAALLGYATFAQLDRIEQIALNVNQILFDVTRNHGILLADFKIEVGFCDNTILVADEISPDTCRFWDAETGASLDKDIYRHSEGDPLIGYREVLRRISS